MKVASILMAAMAVSTATALNYRQPVNRKHGCYRTGMPCNKVKRAIDAATEILDESVDTNSPLAKRCFEPGQPCAKAKRAEDALRASIGDADFENFDNGKVPDHHFCEDGKPCPKGFKRVIGTDLPFTELEANDDANADHSFCHGSGQQCDKVKRAAEAISEVLSKRDPLNYRQPVNRKHGCYRTGMPCNKAKRDLCFRNGQPCNNANRAIDYLDVAAADATDYVTEDLPGSEYSGWPYRAPVLPTPAADTVILENPVGWNLHFFTSAPIPFRIGTRSFQPYCGRFKLPRFVHAKAYQVIFFTESNHYIDGLLYILLLLICLVAGDGL